MKAKYELKDGKILKDGHTMFLEDIVADLNYKPYTRRDQRLYEYKKESLIKRAKHNGFNESGERFRYAINKDVLRLGSRVIYSSGKWVNLKEAKP